MYMVLCTVGGLFLCYAEGLPVLTSLFEAGSAIATVGLTLGVTPTLGAAARRGIDCFNVLWTRRRPDAGICSTVRYAAEYDKIPPGEDHSGIIWEY